MSTALPSTCSEAMQGPSHLQSKACVAGFAINGPGIADKAAHEALLHLEHDI